jgi:hypothetical protein
MLCLLLLRLRPFFALRVRGSVLPVTAGVKGHAFNFNPLSNIEPSRTDALQRRRHSVKLGR